MSEEVAPVDKAPPPPVEETAGLRHEASPPSTDPSGEPCHPLAAEEQPAPVLPSPEVMLPAALCEQEAAPGEPAPRADVEEPEESTDEREAALPEAVLDTSPADQQEAVRLDAASPRAPEADTFTTAESPKSTSPLVAPLEEASSQEPGEIPGVRVAAQEVLQEEHASSREKEETESSAAEAVAPADDVQEDACPQEQAGAAEAAVREEEANQVAGQIDVQKPQEAGTVQVRIDAESGKAARSIQVPGATLGQQLLQHSSPGSPSSYGLLLAGAMEWADPALPLASSAANKEILLCRRERNVPILLPSGQQKTLLYQLTTTVGDIITQCEALLAPAEPLVENTELPTDAEPAAADKPMGPRMGLFHPGKGLWLEGDRQMFAYHLETADLLELLPAPFFLHVSLPHVQRCVVVRCNLQEPVQTVVDALGKAPELLGGCKSAEGLGLFVLRGESNRRIIAEACERLVQSEKPLAKSCGQQEAEEIRQAEAEERSLLTKLFPGQEAQEAGRSPVLHLHPLALLEEGLSLTEGEWLTPKACLLETGVTAEDMLLLAVNPALCELYSETAAPFVTVYHEAKKALKRKKFEFDSTVEEYGDQMRRALQIGGSAAHGLRTAPYADQPGIWLVPGSCLVSAALNKDFPLHFAPLSHAAHALSDAAIGQTLEIFILRNAAGLLPITQLDPAALAAPISIRSDREVG